jgi:hypothetical protein
MKLTAKQHPRLAAGASEWIARCSVAASASEWTRLARLPLRPLTPAALFTEAAR